MCQSVNRGPEMLLTNLLLCFLFASKVGFGQMVRHFLKYWIDLNNLLHLLQLPMQHQVRVPTFHCYPKASNAIISCGIENGTLISVDAKLHPNQNVEPILVSASNSTSPCPEYSI